MCKDEADASEAIKYWKMESRKRAALPMTRRKRVEVDIVARRIMDAAEVLDCHVENRSSGIDCGSRCGTI